MSKSRTNFLRQPLRPRRPNRALASTFLTMIAVGTLFLMLPWSTPGRSGLGAVDALFMATSASCVTGLAVIDPATELTGFGQFVILAMIQLGGLGIMTLSGAAILAATGRLGARDKAALLQVLDADGIGPVPRMIRFILLYTLGFEVVGVLALLAIWSGPNDPGTFDAIFHAVSAFCNAGFSTFSDSLVGFRGDVAVHAVLGTLIVAGGLGFAVLWNLTLLAVSTFRRRVLRDGHAKRTRLTLHSKIVLAVTTMLLVVGAASFFAFEAGNTLRDASPGETTLACGFQSITTRTAGFHTVDVAELRPPTRLVMMGLMFIGAAPGSTAGGVKVTTFALLALAVLALARGNEEGLVVAFRRNVSAATMRKALAIIFLFGNAVGFATLALLVTEGRGLEETLFEVVSAIATVGLGTGLTPELSPIGKAIVTCLMFAGRIGPLGLVIAMSGPKPRVTLQYPEERVVVG